MLQIEPLKEKKKGREEIKEEEQKEIEFVPNISSRKRHPLPLLYGYLIICPQNQALCP